MSYKFKTLKEFVIKDNISIHNTVIYYYVRDLDNSWLIELSGINKENYIFDNMASFKATINKNRFIKFTLIQTNISDIKHNINSIKNEFVMLLGCIIYAKDYSEVTIRKEKINKTKSNNSPVTQSNNSANNKSTHVIKLGEKILYKLDSANDNDTKTFKNKYTRHIDSWEVMGHDRKLKSGKIIHVKPFVKGKGKAIKKDYRV